METEHDLPPAAEPAPTWILASVFGGSLFALVLFWGLMLAHIPQQAVEHDVVQCQAQQRRVQAAFEELVKRKGMAFPDLLQEYGRGATLGPLFGLLEKEGILVERLETPTCRSYKDYTIVDAQHPRLEALSCRIHGGHGALGEQPLLPPAR